MAAKKKKEKEYLWQVVQRRTDKAEVVKVGLPVPLDRAKQIAEYKNATELRRYVVYTLEQDEEIGAGK